MTEKQKRFEEKLAERNKLRATLSPAEYKKHMKQMIKQRRKNVEL